MQPVWLTRLPPSSLPLSLLPVDADLSRFPKVRASSREAAFVPESSPGMMGHIFGSVLAAVTIKPKGLVDGKHQHIHTTHSDKPQRSDQTAAIQGVAEMTRVVVCVCGVSRQARVRTRRWPVRRTTWRGATSAPASRSSRRSRSDRRYHAATAGKRGS